MDELVIDTKTGSLRPKAKNGSSDPYDSLGAVEWVQKQIEYGSQEHAISGKGLLPFLKELQGDLVGCEIGTCLGFTSEYFLKNMPNIKKLYVIDPYPAFTDWNGTRLTEDRQEEIKNNCKVRLSPYKSVNFVYDKSSNFSETIDDESLDFVFIDGDHRFEATLEDIKNYWPKIKNGGLFSGHDVNLDSVQRALQMFFGEKVSEIKIVENNSWFIFKS